VSRALESDGAAGRDRSGPDGDYELAQGLSLRARKRLSGFAAGEQRSPATGGGIEFADYREYAAGDDVRLLDWSVYLRSRKLLVKLCAEEKELTLVSIIDVSRSMNFGTPSKLELAKRIATVLACIAVRGGNRAGVTALGASLLEPIRPERKKLTMSGIARAVHALEPDPRSSPEAALRQFASAYKGKCIAVLISDLLFPGWQRCLDALASSGCEAHVIQVLAPEELAPPDRGEVTLVDMEDGSELPSQLDDALLARYAEALESFLARTGSECARRGLGRCLVGSDANLARVFHEDFVKAGILC
jgi:uncharacterized protein (DUF58 family)